MVNYINEKSLAFRLKVARQAKKIGQVELANKLGISHITLSKYEQGHRVPASDLLERIAKELDCDPGWLLAGETERDRYNKINSEQVSDNISGYGDYAFIEQDNGEISAGSGIEPVSEIGIKVAFRKEWLRRKGDPKNMRLIHVRGDSMAPTLLPGDLILIDSSRNKIDLNGGLYAIALSNEIMIKRLELLFEIKKIKIISDNPLYGAREVNEKEVTINGRVIWFAREIK